MQDLAPFPENVLGGQLVQVCWLFLLEKEPGQHSSHLWVSTQSLVPGLQVGGLEGGFDGGLVHFEDPGLEVSPFLQGVQ